MKVDNESCFNVDSTLTCFLGFGFNKVETYSLQLYLKTKTLANFFKDFSKIVETPIYRKGISWLHLLLDKNSIYHERCIKQTPPR